MRTEGLRRSKYIVSLIFCFCAAWGQSQQTPAPTPTPTVKSTSRLVLVDIIPTDSHGNFVSDLDSSDFKVYEDGKEQKIASFEVQSARENLAVTQPSNSSVRVSATDRPVTPAAISPKQTVNIVLLDSLNTDMADQQQARLGMLKFLRDLPPQQPMIVFALSRRLHQLQDLTDDTARLQATVDKVLSLKSTLLRTPDDNEQQEAELLRMKELGFPTARLRQFLAESDAASLDMRVVITCDALRQLARSVARYPGRKNLLWLSGAYPFAVEPDSRLLDPWTVQRNYAPLVQATAAAMSRENIAVYPIDVRGLVPTGIPASTPSIVGAKEGPRMVEIRERAVVDAQSTMQEIAQQTGGKAFYNSNDLKEAISRSIKDGSSFYLLSYVPPPGTADRTFHKIKVEVRRKHLHLSYRRGYYADQRQIQLNEAQLTRDLEFAMDPETPASTELDITASLELSKAGILTIHYSVAKGQLLLRDTQGRPTSLSFIAVIAEWDKHGKPLSQQLQKVFVPVTTETADQIERAGLNLSLSTKSPPESSLIRLGILDVRTGRIGVTDINLNKNKAPGAIPNHQQS